jgi:hypothetical protein
LQTSVHLSRMPVPTPFDTLRASGIPSGSLQSNTLHGCDDLLIVGWREWVSLPDLGVERIVAKLDTGAAVSSLHADRMEQFTRGKQTWIRFSVPSDDHDEETPYRCQARLIDFRNIRSSNGLVALRPVIETTFYMAGFQWPIEVTLCNRESLECRMLIGRLALAGRCLVDSSRSNLVGLSNRTRQS